MDLETIRNTIEKMTKFNQVEVLRILNKHQDVILNENRYGIHVNMSDLKDEVLHEVVQYVQYVQAQERTLNQDEKQKEDIKNIYFS
jgi:Ni,Fe-hydrogenase III component G